VDKMSMDFRGDPSAALLEVLDPEQNVTFNDHYLDVDYDLSHVMFITTANVRYAIPLPLQDRMEIIELPGYLHHDKREIARRHIIPRQLEEHGLGGKKISFTDQAIDKVIGEYTREAGVRNLEREIATLCRKVAKDVVLGKAAGRRITSLEVTPRRVEEYLGVPRFRTRQRRGENRVGSVTGLFSAISGRPARSDVAMTGEITLRGEVLAIGGLNEKLIAAQRSGIRTVLIPEENVKDLTEIPERIKEGLTILPIARIEDALPHVFAPRRRGRRKRS
jgi:ATP-dependent Lon protease